MSTDFILDINGINLATKNLNFIFKTLITLSNIKLQSTQKTNQQRMRKNVWFDDECAGLRKELTRLSNKNHRDPSSQTLRLSYSDCLQSYKRLLWNKREKYFKAKKLIKLMIR